MTVRIGAEEAWQRQRREKSCTSCCFDAVQPTRRIEAGLVAALQGDGVSLGAVAGEEVSDLDAGRQSDVGTADLPTRHRLAIERKRHEQVLRRPDGWASGGRVGARTWRMTAQHDNPYRDNRNHDDNRRTDPPESPRAALRWRRLLDPPKPLRRHRRIRRHHHPPFDTVTATTLVTAPERTRSGRPASHRDALPARIAH